MEFDFDQEECASTPGHKVDPEGSSATVVTTRVNEQNDSQSLECNDGSGVNTKREHILFSDDDVVLCSDPDAPETNRYESALPQVVKLSKIVYPTIIALGDKVDLERRHRAESRCCDFFVKQINTKKEALYVYTILSRWFIYKSIVDETSSCYVPVTRTLRITSTHMRKLMKVFHMVFKYEFKAESTSYVGLARSWGTKLPTLIESMYTYITPEKCMQICTPYLVKWKENGLVSRPIVNAAIEKANRVTQAHIKRRERRQMQNKKKKRSKRKGVSPARKKTKIVETLSNNTNSSSPNKIPMKTNVAAIEGLSDEEDVTCITPPPLLSDDIPYDTETHAKQSNDITYEEYVKRADQAQIAKIFKAKQKYDSVDFTSISIDDYLRKRKTLLPDIYKHELRTAMKRDKLTTSKNDSNTIWTTDYSDERLDRASLHSQIDDDAVKEDNDCIDRRTVLTPIFPTPIDEAIRAETIDNIFQVLKNVLVYNINPEGTHPIHDAVSSALPANTMMSMNQPTPSDGNALERSTLLGNAKYGSVVPKGIAKMIGNYIFDLVSFRRSRCSDQMLTPNNADGDFMQPVDSTVIVDPLFGTPTNSVRNISKDKRFAAFESRLGSTEYGEKLNTNRLVNLFLYIEWQCLRKNILQMRSRQGIGTQNLADFHIEVVRHPASVRSEDNLLELTLSCIGGSPIKAKYNTIKILESHFNRLKKSYILHHATMLRAVLAAKETVGIASRLAHISMDTNNRSVFLGYVFALVLRYEKLFSGNAGSQSVRITI
eukprot:g6506.t1